MVELELPSLFQALLSSAVLYAIHYIYWQLTFGASRRALIKEHDCKPIKSSAELNSFPENIYGTKVLKENIAAAKQHRLLLSIRERFARNGNTTYSKVLMTEIIGTIEPENLKAMLATQFNDFGLPPRRLNAFTPLLGNRIFTTNGAA